jgi:hypothetical protein
MGKEYSDVGYISSHTWTNTLPTESYLQLTDFQYKIATRTRLGLKPLPILPQTCADCQSPMDSHCDHFLTCVYRRKNELNIRHDQISNLIARIVKMVGGCATVEPLHLNRENRQRTDLEVHLDDYKALIDVSVVHPTAPSYLTLASKGPLEVAKRAANLKRKKYLDLIKSNDNCNFIPFVVETYGGMCSESINFNTIVANFADRNNSPHSWRNVSMDICASVSIAIQRGNGMAARSCLSMLD